MKDPFSLIVVHGDGARVLRVNLPRWIAYATLGLIATVATGTIGLSGGYVFLLRESGRRAALRQRADDQRLLDSLETRIAEVRSEITAWRTLHDKMWRAFGLVASPEESRSAAGPGPRLIRLGGVRRRARVRGRRPAGCVVSVVSTGSACW